MKHASSIRFFSTLTTAAVALSLISTAQALDWLDDFSDGDAEDGDPVTWTYNEIGFTPGDYDASSGDYVLTGIDEMNDDEPLAATVGVTFTDTSVRAQTFADGGEATVGVVARFNPFLLSGYNAILSDQGHLQVRRVDGGAPVDIFEIDSVEGVDATSDFLIQMDIFGSDINVTVWRPDEPMPAPQATLSDSTYTEGRAGIFFNENQDTGTSGVYRFVEARDTVITDGFEADFDEDGDVDGNDFLRWQTGFPTPSGAAKMDGDYDNDGDVDGNDFLGWQAEFPSPGSGAGSAAVPEPASLFLALAVLSGTVAVARRRGCD